MIDATRDLVAKTDGRLWAALVLTVLALPATAGPLAAQCNAPGGPAFISIDSPSVIEGNAGTTTLNFTITVTGGDVFAITDWATFPISATDGVDYIGQSGEIDAAGEPPAGDTETYPISITVNGDLDFEPDETLELRITNASVGPPCFCGPGGGCPSPVGTAGTGTILNDDVMNNPPTADANGPYSVAEGGSVGLSAAGSSDPEQATNTLTFEWDLDNDGAFDDATGISPSFSAAGRDGPDSQTIKVKVTDSGGLSDVAMTTVSITNVAPTITSITASPASIDEGQSTTVSGTFSDPALALESYTGTATWSDGALTAVTVGPGGTFSTTRPFPDDDPTGTPSDTFTVDITIDDGDGGSDTATSPIVTVNNVAPTVDPPTVDIEPSDEGEQVEASADFSDPGVDDTFTCTVDYGESDGPQAGTVAGTNCTGPPHVYGDNGSYTVEVCVEDDDTGSGCNSSTHVVLNVPPTVDPPVVDIEPSDEGEEVEASADFTDPGEDDSPFTCTVDYGDGSGDQSGTVSGMTCTGPGYTYADNGTYTVEICVTDKDLGEGCASAPHEVDNVDPSITATTNSAADCGDTPEGGLVEVSADFEDPGFDSAVAGTLEDFDASEIDWGDGDVEPATIAETPGSAGTPTTGTASGSHIYASGGIFTITITVEDDDGGSDSVQLIALVSGAGLNAGEVQIVGTDLKDVVNIAKKDDMLEVMADFIGAGKVAFPLVDVVSMRALVCDGNDQVHVDHQLTVPSILEGGAGSDHLRAGNGPTHLAGDGDDDYLYGGAAVDVVDGDSGNDQLWGGPNDDTLLGGEDDDRLFGEFGNDLLDGGPGIDECNGGPADKGTDVIVNCE